MLRDEGYDAAVEREDESRLAVGNGFLGVRASLEMPTLASRPRTFVAGLFDVVNGAPGGPFLAPAPDWLRLALTVNGHEVALGDGAEHSRTLDLQSGLLRSMWEYRAPSGLLRLSSLRLASLSHRSTALQVVRVVPEGRVRFELAALLVPSTLTLLLEGVDGPLSYWRTAGSRRGLTIAMKTELFPDNAALVADEDGSRLARRWSWDAAPGEPAVFVRTMAFARESQGKDRTQCARATTMAVARGRDEILASHTAAWSGRWRASDVEIEGDDEAQRAVRYAVYQLVSAANPEDEHCSVGARGLTGDAYGGHVFWDTEIFLLPFYTFTCPEAARAMLMYRYHTLPAAREKAARLGYAGALYAWESADTGEEATPEFAQLPNGETVPILSGTIEQHISADIAYATWQYWEATGDESFLADAGAEILLETARFWASRAVLEADGQYHVRGVIGPDEYHEDVDDNAYTNVMAQWNLETGVVVARLMRSRWPERWAELTEKLGLTAVDPDLWSDVARRMYSGLDAQSGLYEQFSGFLELERVDLSLYEPRSAPMDVLLGRDRTQRSQVIKQADVVMLIALLWDRFAPAVREANYRYYESRCGHGSSLSPAAHSLVAARLGDVALAEQYFRETAAIDLGDAMGNASGGVHIGALGGLWQAVVLGLAGLSVSGEGLSFDPHLPDSWASLSFAVRYHDGTVRVSAQNEAAVFSARLEQGSRPVAITVGGVTRVLQEGEAHQWRIRGRAMQTESAT